MKSLTRAEEQLMHNLWKIEKGVLKEIVDQFPEPKPATSTVGTVIRNLVKKKFIAFERYGKVNLYYPQIEKNEYFKILFNGLMNDYFNNSIKKFASFFSTDTNLNLTELEEIKYIIEDEIKKRN